MPVSDLASEQSELTWLCLLSREKKPKREILDGIETALPTKKLFTQYFRKALRQYLPSFSPYFEIESSRFFLKQ